MLSPNELVFTFGVLTSVPISVKVDEEMQLRECAQTDTRMTDANRSYDLCLCLPDWRINVFIICPMLYSIAIGEIKALGKYKTLKIFLKM